MIIKDRYLGTLREENVWGTWDLVFPGHFHDAFRNLRRQNNRFGQITRGLNLFHRDSQLSLFPGKWAAFVPLAFGSSWLTCNHIGKTGPIMPRPTAVALCWFRSPACVRAWVRTAIHSYTRSAPRIRLTHGRTHTRRSSITRDDHRYRATGQEVATVAHISARESWQKVKIRGRPRMAASLPRERGQQKQFST